MRVAGLQTAGTPGDIDANLRELDSTLARAAGQGVDLLITPELFVTGYDIGDSLYDLARFDAVGAVRAMAVAHGLAVMLGYAEHTPAGLYNSAVLLDRNGAEVLHVRKLHLFGDMDRAYFLPATHPSPVVSFGGLRVSGMICYDVEFPEYVRYVAQAGCELLLVPTAQMEPYLFSARELVRTRAWENQIYLAYINHTGRERDTVYVGNSRIIAPDATVLAQAGLEEALIVADIQPGVVERAQHENPFLTDRRLDVYREMGLTA
ncbi:hydrolase [Komagataeibacter diospyri]|uniref:carbon-nitrogen hydrolase family protein n=1 Tax=Komagataeibacter diospyri TaxID=1932662 RepID=UPI001139A0F2|nr:carbon-nitrogen hydrolase family protein [Komagataeibacter diospyri]GCE89329.1 hydrolase [Komagataeibacter diospyri]